MKARSTIINITDIMKLTHIIRLLFPSFSLYFPALFWVFSSCDMQVLLFILLIVLYPLICFKESSMFDPEVPFMSSAKERFRALHDSKLCLVQ